MISLIGGLMCIGGEILRKAAMLTARTNFNHIVQSVREEGHQLVTHGVYSICRHPSYVGWFYWSIGTQVNYIPNTSLWFETYAYTGGKKMVKLQILGLQG